ncbi:MAG TPA: ParB N-terminal domain-containing protein [Alphaproteobacteria bacterium]|jgi:ParB-like chromosome segregation protein Spo0J|nr:ParB N-terminal domain-containing protein [Alphaproteobacteria bacterium]|tara:strand:- start:69 stop:314 length:246 start_codon:yes stop_codon:yes gene_type:complete
MEDQTFEISQVYVPVAKRRTLDAAKVAKIAESMLDDGQKTPILVREGDGRLVLVEGLHRLEASKSLGEDTIVGLLVRPPRR